MQTDRRSGLRKSVAADVVIDNQPNGLARGRVTNVSVAGLYVRTGATTPVRSQVELVILRRTEQGTRVYRVPTVVARNADEGLGLAVRRYDLDTFRSLVALLLHSDATITAPAGNPADDRNRLDPVLAGTAGTADVAVARVVPISPRSPSGEFS